MEHDFELTADEVESAWSELQAGMKDEHVHMGDTVCPLCKFHYLICSDPKLCWALTEPTTTVLQSLLSIELLKSAIECGAIVEMNKILEVLVLLGIKIGRKQIQAVHLPFEPEEPI